MKKKQKNKADLVVGLGEVGDSLKRVLESIYSVDSFDINPKTKPTGFRHSRYRVINICFPYHKDFVDNVISYILQFEVELAIIHSSIPVGTTKKINDNLEEKGVNKLAVHSPIRGLHPNLSRDIKEFVKYVGYDDKKYGVKAKEYLENANIQKFKLLRGSKNSEAGKLLSTFQYGSHIWVSEQLEKACKQLDLDYELVVKEWNETYNQGYDKRRPKKEKGEKIAKDFHRPILVPDIDDGFGGHCIASNIKLLAKNTSFKLLKILKKIGQK